MTNLNMEKIVEEIIEKAKLEALQRGASVEVFPSDKLTNGVLYKGITIRNVGEKVGTTVYLTKQMFEEIFYNKDREIESFVMRLFDTHEPNTIRGVEESLPDLFDYETVKGSIYPVFCSFETCEEELKDLPHRRVLDLAIYYRIFLAVQGEIATLRVTDSLQKHYGVTEEDLYRQAVANGKEQLDYQNVIDLMNQMIQSEEPVAENTEDENTVYILSNKKCYYGTGVILCKEQMEEVLQQMGVNRLILLPASIHEWLFLKEDQDADVDILKKIVQRINQETVAEEEVLSNNIYYYDLESGFGMME